MPRAVFEIDGDETLVAAVQGVAAFSLTRLAALSVAALQAYERRAAPGMSPS